jgi:hypothetical protein
LSVALLPLVNANRYRPTQPAALILSPDALGAALLGAAVEVSGLKVGFPGENETPRDALRRMRPSYVLIDCDDSAAADESLIGPALMTGARIFLFGADSRMRLRKHLAIRFHMGIIVLPNDTERIATILATPATEAPASKPV